MKKTMWRWIPALGGLLMSAMGTVAMLRPQGVVQILPIVLGAVLVGLGIWDIYTGFSKGGQTSFGLPRCMQGIIDIIVGMVLVLNRSVSVAFLGVVLGLWAFVSGVLSVRMAWSVRHTYGVTAFIDGGLKLCVGAAMMASPLGGMKAWVAILGLFGIFTGVSVIVSTFYWNKLE